MELLRGEDGALRPLTASAVQAWSRTIFHFFLFLVNFYVLVIKYKQNKINIIPFKKPSTNKKAPLVKSLALLK